MDEFDNGILDEAPWIVASGMPPLMSEADGTLQFTLDQGNTGYEFVRIPGLDISNGYAAVHLVALPQDDSGQFLLRVVPSSGVGEGVEIQVTNNSEIVATLDGLPVQFVNVEEDLSELWLEASFEAGVASFAYSLDGDDFVLITSLAVKGDYSAVDVSLMGGSFQPTTAPLHVIEVDDFEFCTQFSV